MQITPQHVDGIQADSSFHQHGPQLYLGWGYGGLFSHGVLETELLASGTPLAMNDSAWDIFAGLLLDGQQLATRGPNFDYAASGRLMTYNAMNDSWGLNGGASLVLLVDETAAGQPNVHASLVLFPAGHYHYFAAVTDSRAALPTFAPPLTTPLAVVYAPLLAEVNASRARSSEIQQYAARIYGAQPRPPPLVLNRLYYDSDYMVHHRAAYTATVRVFSNRTINSECVNTENLQGATRARRIQLRPRLIQFSRHTLGRDLADGVTNIYMSGQEYDGVFPVWQWSRIPGTLELQDGEVVNCSTVSLHMKTMRMAHVRIAANPLLHPNRCNACNTRILLAA